MDLVQCTFNTVVSTIDKLSSVYDSCAYVDQVQYRVRKKRRKKKPSVNSTGVQLAKYRKESLVFYIQI